MKTRKWIFAVAAMAVVVLVMFPLNLLWVGKSQSQAFISSLLCALPALLVAWSPRGRRSGRRAKPAREKLSGAKPAEEKPAGKKPRLSIVVLGICLAVLVAMLTYDICTGGVAVGITKAIGFAMLILVAAVGYKFGYLKF